MPKGCGPTSFLSRSSENSPTPFIYSLDELGSYYGSLVYDFHAFLGEVTLNKRKTGINHFNILL